MEEASSFAYLVQSIERVVSSLTEIIAFADEFLLEKTEGFFVRRHPNIITSQDKFVSR